MSKSVGYIQFSFIQNHSLKLKLFFIYSLLVIINFHLKIIFGYYAEETGTMIWIKKKIVVLIYLYTLTLFIDEDEFEFS